MCVLPRRGHVHRIVGRRAVELRLARVGDRDRAAVRQRQRAGVAGLAAAERIEHRAVEPDAVVADGLDDRLAVRKIGVVAK